MKYKIANLGNSRDAFAGGRRLYLARNSTIETDDVALAKAAGKLPLVRVTENFGRMSITELRKLASQRGIKKSSRFTKKKLLEKLQAR